MPIQIDLGPELESKLQKRAAAAGKDPETYALEAVTEKLERPATFGEILEPIRKAARASGMSDAERDEFLHELIAESRRERKTGS